MRFAAALAVFFPAVTGMALAEQPCDLQGAWELVSGKYDNEVAQTTYASLKIFTKTRFAVVGGDTALRGSMLSAGEVLDFYSNIVAVGGSYTVSGGSWTEKLDHCSNPAYCGLSLTFRCTHEADRLIQKGTIPVFSGGKKTGDITLEEVWRRVDRP